MSIRLTRNFWESRWVQGQTGWDIGSVSPIMQDYILQIENPKSKILIPGCGSAHEADFMLQNGFKNVTILDISPSACVAAQKRFKDRDIVILCEDFFEHRGKYDYILEQTFFCALDPSMRPDYAQKTRNLLSAGGTLFGLLFDRVFDKEGPPFGGDKSEYYSLFEPLYDQVSITDSEGSIPEREGTEVFIEIR